MPERCYDVSFMLSVTFKPFTLIVVKLNVVMLSAVAPSNQCTSELFYILSEWARKEIQGLVLWSNLSHNSRRDTGVTNLTTGSLKKERKNSKTYSDLK